MRGLIERMRDRVRWFAAIANGIADLDDPILKLEVERHKADRDGALAALEQAKATAARPILADPALDRFTTIMRGNVMSGDVPFRKAYIGSVVERVEVDDNQIRIVGSAELLETAMMAGGAPRPRVRSFVREWRARRDSNS
ncbi:MAG: hypothetical protein K2Y27_01340 [Xanthobacteraceae bacterium]|nr:hypothetical protein [Xanthobacteraceae bacterium]